MDLSSFHLCCRAALGCCSERKKLDYLCNCNSEISNFCNAVQGHVDILLLTETEVHTNLPIKLEGCQLFRAVRSKRQGGGILVAIKYGLCSSIMVDKGEEAEFITVPLRFDDKHTRLVLVYGPQENDSVNKIAGFYDSISVQVERVNDSLFLVGVLMPSWAQNLSGVKSIRCQIMGHV